MLTHVGVNPCPLSSLSSVTSPATAVSTPISCTRAEMAQAVAALPTIIVYLALGKFFMRGLLAGSLKG